MMQSKQFIITLREDTVISQSAVTTGGHTGLDYLPGSAILGAVASKLYDDFDKKLAWDVFHSGKVRFGNALPVSDEGYSGYPIPRSWYRYKDEASCKVLRKHAYNCTVIKREGSMEQYRGEYCTLAHNDAELYAPVLQYRMKTAVDPKKGLAAESQLFGYSNLSAGEKFSFKLEACDEIDPSIFKQITKVLLNEAIYIGRSRSAEYGAVRIEEAHYEEVIQQPETEASEVTLWLLSDAVVYDGLGMPTLQPDAQAIGLPEDWENWELDTEKTFVFNRRYAPYNKHYGCRELEREAIGMGSVLHYKRKNDSVTPLSVDALVSLQQQGIGSYKQAGLGRVLVNPPQLADKKPKSGVAKAIIDIKKKGVKSPPADSLLLRYLDRQADNYKTSEALNKQADEWAQELVGLYKAAKKLVPYADVSCIGPSPTQWGRVMEVSRGFIESSSEDIFNELSEQLFSKNQGVCKPQDVQWTAKAVVNVSSRDRAEMSSFRDWLMDKIHSVEKDEHLPDIVARFARLATNVAQKQSCPSSAQVEKAND